MNRWVKCMLLIAACCASIATFVRADDLRQRLREIDGQIEGSNTDTKKLERQGLNLLDQYTSPEERGRIYAQIAHVYAQSGLKEPDRLGEYAEYCEKALQYPLDVVAAVRMYGYWASALWSGSRRQVHSRESPWDQFREARREIASLFLRGMKLILDQGTPAEAQPLPMVGKFRCRPVDSPECQDMVKKHEERRRARARVMLENDLVLRRKMLIDHCVHIYSQEPVATEELAVLAREILRDEDAVTELLARVASRTTDRPDAGGTKRD